MPRHPKKSREAWDDQKERIRTLYIIEGKTLPQLMDIMGVQYSFVASKREYVKRLQLWGMFKYSKTKQRQLAREADLAPQIADILLRHPAINVGISNNLAIREPLAIQNTERSFLSNTRYSRQNNSSSQLIEVVINLILHNIPWLQFQECFVQLIPCLTKQVVLTLNWFHYPGSVPGSLSSGESSMQKTRYLLSHILDRNIASDADQDAPMLQRLVGLLPSRPGHSGSYNSIDPFLMLTQCCIYLSSNNLMDRMDMDGFLDHVLQNGFAPLFNQAIDFLKTKDLPTLHIFLPRLLLSAASLKQVGLVSALLEKGVDPNGCIEGIDVSETDLMGCTILNDIDNLSPLQISIIREDLPTCLVLLRHGADANAMSSHTPFRPLELAITGRVRSCGLVEALFSAGALISHSCHVGLIPDTWIETDELEQSIRYTLGNLLTKAAEVQDMESLLLLLRRREVLYNFIPPLEPALCMATHKNDVEMADLLLQCGANVNVGLNGLEESLRSYITEQFLIYGRGYILHELTVGRSKENDSEDDEDIQQYEWLPTDIPWQIMTPIQLAARQNNLRLAQELLHAGADVNFQLSWEIISCELRKLKGLPKYQAHRQCFMDYELQFLRWGDLLKTALHWSVENGNLEMTKLLLDRGAIVDGVDAVGTTALQLACGLRDLPFEKDERTSELRLSQIRIQLAEMLLDRGANVRMAAGTWNGRTAVQAAAEQGDMDLVRLLIEKGGDPNAAPSSVNGKTALVAAIAAGAPSIADLLVHHGAVRHIEDDWIDLHAAASLGNIARIEALSARIPNISALPPPKSAKGTILNAGVKSRHVDVVRNLLMAGADVNELIDGETALCTAVRGEDYDIFELLLLFGASPTPPGCRTTPLAIAATSGFVSMVDSMLRLGPNIDQPSKYHQRHEIPDIFQYKYGYLTVLQWTVAIYCGSWTYPNAQGKPQFMEIIKMLLSNGADARGSEMLVPVREACWKGDIALVKLLLERGADVKVRSSYNQTALGTAANLGHREIIQVLLDQSPDLSGPMLVEAVRSYSGNGDVVQMLLNAGANTDAVDERGTTVLDAAASHNDIDVVRILLDHGADVNLSSSVLVSAARGRDFNLVKLLVERGANVNCANDLGSTPLQTAAEKGRLDIASLLLENDSQPGKIEERCKQAAAGAAASGHGAMAKYLRRYKRPNG